MTENSIMLWLVLGGAGIFAYFVVSKVIDFFNPAPDPEAEQDDALIGGHDPNKPIG